MKFSLRIWSALISVFFTLFLAAIMSGIVVWFLWPKVVPEVFPTLVKGGHLPGDLDLWTSVGFTWLTSIIFNKTISKG